MKCFVIKCDNQYVSDVVQPLRLIWGITLQLTEEIEKAKHYRNASIPKNWVIEKLKLIKEKHEKTKIHAKERNTLSVNGVPYFNSKLKEEETIIQLMESATIVELDVATPNFLPVPKVRFSRYVNSGYVTIEKRNSEQDVCISCGMILKNISHAHLTNNTQPVKVNLCPRCVKMMWDKTQSAYNELPKTFWDEIDGELMLKQL